MQVLNSSRVAEEEENCKIKDCEMGQSRQCTYPSSKSYATQH